MTATRKPRVSRRKDLLGEMHESFFMGLIEDLISVKSHLEYARAWAPGGSPEEQRTVGVSRHNAREMLTAHVREVTSFLAQLCTEDKEQEHFNLMLKWIKMLEEQQLKPQEIKR